MRDNPNNMESFYEENAQFERTQNNLKRPLTLDLNGTKQQPKRQRLNQSLTAAPVLSSPDLHMLKLASPELEKIIMSNATLQTPTPSLCFPTKVTSEQEEYARGFVDALSSLHNNENSQSTTTTATTTTVTATTESSLRNGSINTTNTMSGGGISYVNLDDSFPVAIKDEPQTVPNSPPMSPIDMESQEKIKLERKRQRNRVAASKCRKRKLERISKLEDKVKILKNENGELGSVILSLKENVFQLKQEVLNHINCGCTIRITGQF